MKSVIKNIVSTFLLLTLFLLSLSFVSADLQTVSLETIPATLAQDNSVVVENTIELTSREIPSSLITYDLIDTFTVNQYDIPQPQNVRTEFVVVQKVVEPTIVIAQNPRVEVQLTKQLQPTQPVQPIPVVQPVAVTQQPIVVPVLIEQQPELELVTQPNQPAAIIEPAELVESFILYAVQKNLSLESCHVYEEKVTVENNGETISTYHFSANAFIANRLTLSQQDFALAPGQSSVVTLTFALECGLDKDTTFELTLETETLSQTFVRNLDVYSASNIDLTLSEINVTSCSCENKSIPFTLKNTGTHMENYSFSVSDYADSLYLSENSIMLAPNQTYEGILQTSFCGDFGDHDFTITVETQYSGYTATQSLDYTIDPCADFTVTLPTQVDICRYSDLTFPFEISNDATFSNEFAVSFFDDAGIGSIENTSLTLAGLDSKNVTVSLKARDLAVGEYNMTVEVTDAYAQITKFQHISLSVTNCYDYQTIAESQTYDVCPTVETIPLFIENVGLYTEDFHFSLGTDDEFNSLFSIEKTAITLAPGENITLALTLNGVNVSAGKRIPLDFITRMNSTAYRENVLKLDFKTQSAESCYGVLVSPPSWRSVSLNGSGYEQLQVTLTNDGLRRGTYNVSLHGDDFLSLETNTIVFSPGQSATVNVSHSATNTTINGTYVYQLNITSGDYSQVENIKLDHNAESIWQYVLIGIIIIVIIILLLIYAPILLLVLLILALLIGGILFLKPLDYIIGSNEVVNQSADDANTTTGLIVLTNTSNSTTPHITITVPTGSDTGILNQPVTEPVIQPVENTVDKEDLPNLGSNESSLLLNNSDNATVTNESYVEELDTTLQLIVSPQKFLSETVAENESAIIHSLTVQNTGETVQDVHFDLSDSPVWMNLDLTKARLSPNESVMINIFTAPNASVVNKTYVPLLVITALDNQTHSVDLTFKHNNTSHWELVLVIVLAILLILLLFALLPFWFVIALLFFIIPLVLGILSVPYAVFSTSQVSGDVDGTEKTNTSQILNYTDSMNVTLILKESDAPVDMTVVDTRLVELKSFLDNDSLRSNESKLIFIDQNTTYELNISNSFIDPDDDNLTYEVNAVDISNVSLMVDNNVISITPDADYIGHQAIRIIASDGELEVESPDIHLIIGPRSLLDVYRNPSMYFVYVVAAIVLMFIIFIIILDMTRISNAGRKKRISKRK